MAPRRPKPPAPRRSAPPPAKTPKRPKRRPSGGKRTGDERELDLLFIAEQVLRKASSEEIRTRLNARLAERAALRAKDLGLDAVRTASAIAKSSVTIQTVNRDIRSVTERARSGAAATMEQRAIQWLAELELERQVLERAERLAWEALERIGREETRTEERADYVERPRLDASGKPVLGADGKPKLERGLKPVGVVRFRETVQLDPAIVGEIRRLVELRVRIYREMFEVRAMMSGPTPVPIDLDDLGHRHAALERMMVKEIEFMYTAEARAAGRPVDQQRVRLLQSFLQSQRPATPPPNSPAPTARTLTVTARMIGPGGESRAVSAELNDDDEEEPQP